MINKKINIAVIGLGQVGNYLLNELNTKKMILRLKLVKKFILLEYLQKIKTKKDVLRLINQFFLKIRLKLLNLRKLMFYSK